MAGKTKKKPALKKKVSACSVENYKNKIITFLENHNKKFMDVCELGKKCRTKKNGIENFNEAVAELRREGKILMRKGGKIALCKNLKCFPGKISRLSRTFGFAVADDGTEYFIPGKCSLGVWLRARLVI